MTKAGMPIAVSTEPKILPGTWKALIVGELINTVIVFKFII